MLHLPANFFFYPDTDNKRQYAPAVYFHGLKKYIKENPITEPLILIDSDIAFTRYLDFQPFMQDQKTYLSDTSKYTSAEYIKKRGNLTKMCDIVGINPEIVENTPSGGAQYIIKDLPWELVDKVEKDSKELNEYLRTTSPDLEWLSGMFAFLWNLWLAGYETEVHPDLDFIMGTADYDKINEVAIYHNSGIRSLSQGFHKGSFINESIYGKHLDLPKNASYWYYEQTQKIKTIL